MELIQESFSTQYNPFLEIQGKLSIENYLIERFESQFIAVFGTLLMTKDEIRNNAGARISLSEAIAQISAGTILDPFSTDCTFPRNSGIKALL